MTESEVLRLEDLVRPLSAQSFIEAHWRTAQPYLSQPNSRIVRALSSVPRLNSAEAYLAQAQTEVSVFGPNAFRSKVPAAVALDFLGNGFNLYITRVDHELPEAKSLFAEIARELGVAPWQIHLEAFAGRPGGISSRHYDHDTNLQVLMQGEKQWSLETNRAVRNPLLPYHPRRDGGGRTVGFTEELYAEARLPDAFDPGQCQMLTALPGSVMFVPRGCWHETRSLTTTWGVNLVIKGVTWAVALASALVNRLHADPDFRMYCESAVYSGNSASSAQTTPADDLLRKLRMAASTVLADVTPDEVALAMVSDWYEWSAAAAERRIVDREGRSWLEVEGLLEGPLELDGALVPVLRRLVGLTQPFSWAQTQALAGQLGAIGLYNLLTDLTDNQLLVRRA